MCLISKIVLDCWENQNRCRRFEDVSLRNKLIIQYVFRDKHTATEAATGGVL